MAISSSSLLEALLVSAAAMTAGCGTPARQPAASVAVSARWNAAQRPSPACACACPAAAVSAGALPALTHYQLTHARVQSSSAMPFVEELAHRTGHDLAKVGAVLLPAPRPMGEGELPDEGLALGGPHIFVGSIAHTTTSWSYVLGDSIRIHQLLPLGARGFVVLYSWYSPDEILFQRTMAEWRLALFAPDDRLAADVSFLTRIPHRAPGSWSAIQTALTTRSGRLLAEVRYVRGAPARDPNPAASVAPEQLLQLFEVLVDVGTNCLSIDHVALVQDGFVPVAGVTSATSL